MQYLCFFYEDSEFTVQKYRTLLNCIFVNDSRYEKHYEIDKLWFLADIVKFTRRTKL